MQKNRIYYAQRACGILYRFLQAYSGGVYLLPANVCPVVPLTFKAAKVGFEFVDIDLQTYCIDENRCLELLEEDSEKYEGIVFVRTYGFRYDTTPFFRRLREIKKCFKIIDDRCLQCPNLSAEPGEADLILYSTGYAKYVNLGGGGIGIAPADLFLPEAVNSAYTGREADTLYKKALADSQRMKEFPATWLDASDMDISPDIYKKRLEKTKAEIILHKTRLNTIYRESLPEEIQLEPPFQEWRFNILTDHQEKILKHLFECNLFASSHYKPCNVLFDDRHYPNAERLYSKIVNLFNDFFFSEEQALQVCEVINKYL